MHSSWLDYFDAAGWYMSAQEDAGQPYNYAAMISALWAEALEVQDARVSLSFDVHEALDGQGCFDSDGSSVAARDSTASPNTPPVRRTATEPVETGAVEGKPQFDAAPALALEDGVDYRAVIELENGVIELDLFETDAPIHVNNFVFLVEKEFYDGLTFHRVVPGFVAQGGDPTAIGTGGAGYTLPDEQVADEAAARLTLDARGVISMARSGAGASSSQFFITLSPSGFLDEQSFTAFGEVTSGMELLDAFAERDPAAQPPDPAGPTIVSISIERAPPAANTEE